jgi:hypothetical protein
MSHDDFEQRFPKRRRLSNEFSISGIEGRQHRHNPYGYGSTETWRPPASVVNSVSIQYERFDYSRETSIGYHDNSINLQHQCTSLHASASPQTLARTTEASLSNYSENHEHLLHRDAHSRQSLAAILNPEITGAPAPDVTSSEGEEGMAVCFGMVSRIIIFGGSYRSL